MFQIFKKSSLRKRVLILSALPETEAEFVSLCSAGTSDFIRSLKSTYKTNDVKILWKHYKKTGEHLEKTLDFIINKGGSVVRDFNIEQLNMIHKYDYVVLLAHHSNLSDEIEVGGRLEHTRNIIKNIPENSKIVFDITSCYSAYLIPRIKCIIPDSKIIGIGKATTLDVRLDVLKQIIRNLCKDEIDYISQNVEICRKIGNSLKINLSTEQLPLAPILHAFYNGWINAKTSSNTSDIKLGSKLLSSVYAPCEVPKGEDFVISIFIHKPADEDEVTIMARAIDEDAEKRYSMPIKVKLKKGDKIDFQLWSKGLDQNVFEVDETNKDIIWDGEIESVEYIVTVPIYCWASSFVGKIIMAINNEKVGDMSFKVKVSSSATYEGAAPCASFDFVQTDKKAIMANQKTQLLEKLVQHRNKHADTPEGKKDVEMCDKCIELLQELTHVQNNGMLRVFISSTSDMKTYRDLLKECVLKCEMYPEMYEMWGLEDKYPRDMCVQHVLDSDIFVCVLGSSYGFVEPVWDMSMTEIEYRVAVAAGLPTLIYIDSNYKDNAKFLSESAMSLFYRQESLIDELRTNSVVYIFENPNKLELKSILELSNKKYTIKS